MRRYLGAVMAAVLLAGPARADEEAAVKAVEKRGGKVRRDDKAPGKPVVAVDLRSTLTTDADLKVLKECKHLQVLDLGVTQVTDAGLKELKELRQLQELDLSGTKVTDAGVADLQKALPKCRIARDDERRRRGRTAASSRKAGRLPRTRGE